MNIGSEWSKWTRIDKPIVLASASPRRREILDRTGLKYTIDPADADENINDGSPESIVKELSARKAAAVLERHTDSIVIGADTVVVADNQIMGKPKDKAEALSMLKALSGRIHLVYTGVSLMWISPEGQILKDSFSVCTKVRMYDNPEELLEWYVDTGEPMDKAGSYGIQGTGSILIEGIEGSYDNVVGLPLAELVRRLKYCQ